MMMWWVGVARRDFGWSPYLHIHGCVNIGFLGYCFYWVFDVLFCLAAPLAWGPSFLVTLPICGKGIELILILCKVTVSKSPGQ